MQRSSGAFLAILACSRRLPPPRDRHRAYICQLLDWTGMDRGDSPEPAGAAEDSVRPADLPWWRLLLPAVAFAGCQLSWAVQIGSVRRTVSPIAGRGAGSRRPSCNAAPPGPVRAWSRYTTPTLRKLGLTDEVVSLVWLAGPLSGMFVQPVVGALSDASRSKWGRRRPYMAAGATSIAISLLVFAFAKDIGATMGDEPGRRPAGLAVAILAFCVLDCAINVLQGPMRALLADVVPAHQLTRGNAFFAVCNGAGKVVGYSLGGALTSVRALYSVAAALVLTLCTVTVVGVPEPRPPRDASDDAATAPTACGRARGSLVAVVRGLRAMPSPVARAFLVQCATYLAWFATFIYATDWAGKEVFGGDADAKTGTAAAGRFREGVRIANVGLALMGGLSVPVGLALPRAATVVGLRPLWSASLLVMAAAMGLAPAASSGAWVMVLFAALSVPLAACFTVPWSIVTTEARKRGGGGVMTATFNLSQCLPEIVTAVAAGPVIRAAGGDLNAVMLMGAASAALGAALVWRVVVPVEGEEVEEAGSRVASKGGQVELGRRRGRAKWSRLSDETEA